MSVVHVRHTKLIYVRVGLLYYVRSTCLTYKINLCQGGSVISGIIYKNNLSGRVCYPMSVVHV